MGSEMTTSAIHAWQAGVVSTMANFMGQMMDRIPPAPAQPVVDLSDDDSSVWPEEEDIHAPNVNHAMDSHE